MRNILSDREQQLRLIRTAVAEQTAEILAMVFRESEHNGDPATAIQKITANLSELLDELHGIERGTK